MSKLANKVSRRFVAVALTMAMILSSVAPQSMTVYAAESSMSQTEVESDVDMNVDTEDRDVETENVAEDTDVETKDDTVNATRGTPEETKDEAISESEDDSKQDETTQDESTQNESTQQTEETVETKDGEGSDDKGTESEDPDEDLLAESETTIVHLFDATTIPADGVTDKDPISEGTMFANYFTVKGTVTQKIANEKTTSVETGSKDSGSIWFTVTGSADVEMEVSSNSSNKQAYVALGNTSSGNVCSNEEKVEIVQTKQKLTYKGLEAGTYKIYSLNGDDTEIRKRGVVIYTIKVTETITETEGPITPVLTAPTNLKVAEQLEGDGIVAVTLSWDEVKEADFYKIAIAEQGAEPFYQKDNINKEDKSITITAQEASFERGKTYLFSLIAVRAGTGENGADEEKTTTIPKKISSGDAQTRTYVFNPEIMEDINYMAQAQNGGPKHGTGIGTDRYFSVGIYNKNGYVNPSGQYAVVRQATQAGIEFSVQGTANVLVQAASTGNTNSSPVALRKITQKNAEGKVPTFDANALPEKDGKVAVSGDKNPNDLVWLGLEAGTYSLITPEVNNLKRDLRVFSITVNETSDRADRAPLSLASKPEVKSVVKNSDGTISVSVENALVGYDGGDRLVVVLEDSNGKEVSGARGASGLEGSTHTISIKTDNCETGTYTVKAKLIRGIGDDKEELTGDVTKPFDYRQELKDPTGLHAENMGKTESGSGSVKLSWMSAQGAQYYVVKIIDANGQERTVATPDNNTSYILDSDLTIGQKYTFWVYAASKLGDVEALSTNPAVVENYQIIEGAGDPPFEQGRYELQVSSDIGIFATSDKQDGERQRVGTANYFTIIYNSSSKAENENQTFPDATSESGKLSFNSSARTIGGSIRFATSGPARVTVYWKSTADGREMKIVDGEDEEVKATHIGTTKNTAYVSKLYLSEAGIYYLGGKGGSNDIYKVIVDNDCVITERPEWNSVPDPEILEVKQDKGDILIQVKAKIGFEGANAEADKVEVTMYDKDGEVAGSAKTVLEGAENPTLILTPAASGKYRLKAALSRDELPEDVKYSAYPAEGGEPFQFNLPLEVPKLEKENLQNKGAVGDDNTYGSVELSWESVKESDRYLVTVKGTDTEYEQEYVTTAPAILIDSTDAKGLLVGKTYAFRVKAQRDATGKFNESGECIEPETTEDSLEQSLKIEADYKNKWDFVVYGIGTSPKASGFVAKDGTAAADKTDSSGKALYSSGYTVMKPDGVTPNPDYGVDGKVEPKPADLGEKDFLRIWTWDGKGKMVPGDTDGLAFYYTEVNPNTTNFKLSANLHVNQWRIGNGQEGFGLMATDRIGENGNTKYHWTNSYTAVVSKIDYKWDSLNDTWSTTTGEGVTLRLGIGSTAKTGVTAQNLPIFENDVTTATTKYYKTETLPLETSVHTGKDCDNIIGNETLGATKMWKNPIVDMKLAIELNATGYFVSYTPINDKGEVIGKTETIKYYDRNALSMCEENTAYIGFFATRFADVTFSDVDLTTSRYNPEEPREYPPVEEVKLKASVSGASTANNEDYNLIYSANWKGTVTIEDEAGAVLAQEEIAPREGDLEEEGKITIPVKLHIGTNKFKATYTPDRDFDPYNGNPPTVLTSYDSKVDTVTVTWKKYGKEGEILYVSPKGKATGDGTKVNPLDVYTAVQYAQPGQTIYLIGGTYNLTQTIKINRGINGTKDKMIYMLADPETCTKENGVRPVFDFNSQCPAMVIAGDYWYLQGFDVTRSGNQMKGLQLSGNHNTLDGLNIYKNGSTGLQISRLLGSDKFEDWPSYNLVLNCTSVLNADAGYTDADGFAAKLTVGNGNVFDGCISAYNADDGWDLFAKVWTGPIGIVTIQNSASFENGQVIRDKKTHELVWFNESDNWEIVGAGGNNGWENTSSDNEEAEESWEIIDAGSGNGYKMGGSSITGYHTLKNSVAFHNKSKGIDSNSCNDIQAYNSISYDNASYNIAMYSNAAKTDFAASGVISYRKAVGMDTEDRIGLKDKTTVSSIVGSQEDCVEKIFNNTNFFWNKLIHVSEPGSEYYNHYTTCTDEAVGKNQKPSITVADDWFVSLDYEKWEKNYCMDTPIRLLGRAADGTVDLHGFLELTERGKSQMAAAGAKKPAGLSAGTVSKDANDFLDKVTNGETSGSIDNGGEKDNTKQPETDIAPDDFAQMPGNAEEVGIWIAVVDREQIEYTGKALKPEVHVYSGNKRLRKGKDYTVTYKNNQNAYVGAYDDAYYNKYSEIYKKYTNVAFADLKKTYDSVDVAKRPTIIVKGKGNYKNYDTKNITQVFFDINPVTIDPTQDLANRIGTGDIAFVSKSGGQVVKPTVTFGTKKLSSAKEKDYGFVTYRIGTDGARVTPSISSDAKVGDVGVYEVEITGKNNFAGITTVNLNVVDGSNANILADNFKLKNKIPEQYREGYNVVSVEEEIPLPVTLSTKDLVVLDKEGKELVKDVNYKVSYKNNINIGTATVIVTGLTYQDENGKTTTYVGSKEFTFKIVAPPLNKLFKDQEAKLIDTIGLTTQKTSDGMLKITTETLKDFGESHSYQYEGKAVDPVNDELVDASGVKTKLGLAVKRGGNWYLLVQGKDYKLSYSGNTKKGNASVVFKGIGNYSGSVTQKFQITAFNLDDAVNRLPGEGEAVSKIGGTFGIKRVNRNGEDTYTGTVFKANYTQGFTTYTGLEVTYKKGGVKPTVSLTINGNPLKAGRDYTVTYKNNANPTDSNTPAEKLPTIIIKGKNGVEGTLTGTFTIAKKALDDKADVIKVTAQDVKISKDTGTGSYKTRIVVKDATGKTLSAGSDYDRNIKYEIVDNATRKTVLQDITNEKEVTIPNGENDDGYLTIKATIYPSNDSKYYIGSKEGISAYYRVLYAKNSLKAATFEVKYEAAKEDDSCFYEPTEDNKAFYYYEDGINLNGSMLKVKLGEKELVWGEDFEVFQYVGNDKQGTAKLIIQGKGKYFDTKIITFKIVPKNFKWWEKLADELTK